MKISSSFLSLVMTDRYRKDSINPPGAYFSEIIFRVGAYSRRGLSEGRAYLNLHARRSTTW